MIRWVYILFCWGCLAISTGWAQQTPAPTPPVKPTDSLNTPAKPINMLAPSRAAFYSAVIPGLGQAYNKKYWKIPLVYAALGTTVYFYITNNNKYNDYRDAYKRRLLGFTDDEFSYLDTSRLIQAQRFYQRNRDLSALLVGVFYILNIVDANVDAHLMQYNVSDKLTLQPDLIQNDLTQRRQLGLGISFKF